jgi:hypothetical protein
MDKVSADVIDFATTRDASSFVDAVNSILNRKAADAINNMRQEVAQNIINPATPEDEEIEVDTLEGEADEEV